MARPVAVALLFFPLLSVAQSPTGAAIPLHHGSDGSSSKPFLEAVDPEWAVIPAGTAHGHPHMPVGKAVSLFQRACEGDVFEGCFYLGFMYFEGQGVDQDYAKAVSLYHQACDGDVANGCFDLAAMYHFGDGVDQDDAKAASILDQACNVGHLGACAILIEMCETGVVVACTAVEGE